MEWLKEVFHERDAGIQATPNWCEACRALGRFRGEAFVSSLEPYLWREDARVASDRTLEHYPAIWTLADIGPASRPMLSNAIRGAKEERQRVILALALAKLYGKQNFAVSYLRSQARKSREAGKMAHARQFELVLKVLTDAG